MTRTGAVLLLIHRTSSPGLTEDFAGGKGISDDEIFDLASPGYWRQALTTQYEEHCTCPYNMGDGFHDSASVIKQGS